MPARITSPTSRFATRRMAPTRQRWRPATRAGEPPVAQSSAIPDTRYAEAVFSEGPQGPSCRIRPKSAHRYKYVFCRECNFSSVYDWIVVEWLEQMSGVHTM